MSGLLGPLGGGGGGHRRLLSTSSYSSPPKKVLWLRESVYYLTLNHSSPRATRLFSQRLAQVCSYAEGEYSCLPHYDTQPNSGKTLSSFFTIFCGRSLSPILPQMSMTSTFLREPPFLSHKASAFFPFFPITLNRTLTVNPSLLQC